MTNPDLAAALRAYARFAGVVADQLEALERGDAARQWVLEHERAAAERDVELLLEREGGAVEQVMAAAVGAVGGAAAERSMVRGRIARIDEEARRAAQLVAFARPTWPTSDGEYEECGAGRGAGPEGRTLDVSR